MATHSSILAWRIPWTEKPGNYSLWDHKESDKTERLTHTHTHTHASIQQNAIAFPPPIMTIKISADMNKYHLMDQQLTPLLKSQALE